MSTQPEALRLADELDAYHTRACHKEAAAELRRLHALTTAHGTQPKEDELDALADACTPNTETGSLNYRDFAGKVLARWGTPAMVGEPVAYRHLHEDGWEYYDAPTGEDCDGCEALYTSPQPVRETGDERKANREVLTRSSTLPNENNQRR